MFRDDSYPCLACPYKSNCGMAKKPMPAPMPMPMPVSPIKMQKPMPMPTPMPVSPIHIAPMPMPMPTPMPMPAPTPAPVLPAAEEPMTAKFPDIYIIVNTSVKTKCDEMENTYGMMHEPSFEDLQDMAEEIHKNTDWDKYCKHHHKKHHKCSHEDKECDDPVMDYGIGVDLIHILLLNEILRRKHHHHHYHYYY